MRASLTAAILLLAPFVRAEEDEARYEVVHCGKDTVVAFEGSQSPDKHYALGWTIQPISKDAKPVDWTKLENGDVAVFEASVGTGDYFTPQGESDQKPTHRTINGVIDLRSKSFKPLPIYGTTPLDNPQSKLKAKWIDQQHAVILRNGKWSTVDALFVRLASEPLVATDILPQMNDRVSKLIHEKRPLAPSVRTPANIEGSLYTRYGFTEIGQASVPCKIKDGILHASFWAQIPRSTDGEEIEGHVLISLKDGTPLKAVSDSPDDKPFVSELGEADKQLNQVYEKLRKSRVGDARKELVADQTKWISTRNEQVRDMAREATSQQAIGVEKYRTARNQQALKLTRERTEVLQKQLDAANSK